MPNFTYARNQWKPLLVHKSHISFFLAYLQLNFQRLFLSLSLTRVFPFLKISHYTWERVFRSFAILYCVLLLRKTQSCSFRHTHWWEDFQLMNPIRRQIFSHFFFALRFCVFFSDEQHLEWWKKRWRSVKKEAYFYVFRMLRIKTQRDWLDPSGARRMNSSWSEDMYRWSRHESRLELGAVSACFSNNCTKHSPPGSQSDHRTNKRRSREE